MPFPGHPLKEPCPPLLSCFAAGDAEVMAGGGQSPCTLTQLAGQQDRKSLIQTLTSEESTLPSYLSLSVTATKPGLELARGVWGQDAGEGQRDPACPLFGDGRRV